MTMQKRRLLHREDLGRLLTVGTSLPNQVSVELGVHTDLSVIHSTDLMANRGILRQSHNSTNGLDKEKTHKGGLRHREFFEHVFINQAAVVTAAALLTRSETMASIWLCTI